MNRKIIVYDTDRDLTTNIVLKFAQGVGAAGAGWEVRFQKIDRFRKKGLDKSLRPGVDAVASLGILRGTGEMFKAAAAAGIDYYYMDHAYFNAGYGGDNWMRIVRNGHSMTTFQRSSAERFQKFFAATNTIQPWRNNLQRGDRIVVCPPTHAVSWYTGVGETWTENVIRQLKSILPENQHHRIVVRAKPSEPVVDARGNLLEFRQNTSSGSLDDDLKDAQCAIVYNSMVAVTASLRGIPVIVGDQSCCLPISFKIHDIENPQTFNQEPKNRTQLMHWLANNQWNLTEISNGTAWRMLQENR